MVTKKSPHILSSSSNLLGFCLVVLTSIKISNFTHATIIDDTTGLAAILLVISCIFSFLAIRSKNDRSAGKLEAVADVAFLVALVSIAVTIILVSFNFFG
jgi:hypothetical protein